MRHHTGRQRLQRGVGTVAVLAALAIAAGSAPWLSRPEPPKREVLLGGLFSLTGNWSTLGRTSAAAMELAIADVNKYRAGTAAGVRFAPAIEDTKLDPQIALAKAEALKAKGVQFLIGAQSSAEVAHLKPFVDANGLLLVSPSSTAGSLAIAGDNVFRFTPSDSLEGVVLSAMMWQDGIRAVLPVWRDDAGGVGLERATRARFRALGGVVLDGAKYGNAERDFSGTIAAIRAQVRQAVDQHGANKVAVYIAGFDEAAELFARVGGDSLIESVRWYGSDGLVLSDALLRNQRAAEFAIRTGLPNPIFAREEGARDIWEPLAERIRQRTNVEPDAFALAVYDAVWVVARGYVASGATRDLVRLKQAFTTAARSGYGATGWTVLNEAGDRRYGDFAFWAIRRVGGVPRWTRVAYFETRTGRLVRDPSPAVGISAGAANREPGPRSQSGSPE